MARPTDYKVEYDDEVENFLAQGLSIQAYAGHIGVHKDTIYEWCKVHKSFSDSIKRGEAKSVLWWEQAINSITLGMDIEFIDEKGNTKKIEARKANPTLLIFQLKNRAGWKDRLETRDGVEEDMLKQVDEELKKEDPDDRIARIIARHSKTLDPRGQRPKGTPTK